MTETVAVDSTVIKEGDPRRMSFLPKHFGRTMLAVEARIYVYATRVLEGYSGGAWDFVEKGDVGYLRPNEDMQEPSGSLWHWRPSDLSFGEGRLSADAAGLALTIFAVNHEWHLDPENEQLGRAWQLLMNLAFGHPERARLMPLLD
jgi:hypothetical protein